MEDKLLKAVQRLLDLQAEKKAYLKEINDQINEAKDEIEALAKE